MKHTDAAVSASSGPRAAVAILLQNLKDNLKDFFFFFKKVRGAKVRAIEFYSGQKHWLFMT